MSYQEKNVIASAIVNIILLGFYLLNLRPIFTAETLNPTAIYSLSATVIVLGIIANISASVLTQIVTTVVQAVITQEEVDEDFTEDERDKLIGLRGMRNSYLVFSIGTVIAMVTMVMNQPPLVMFVLILLAAIIAEIIGDFSRLFYYRRGF